MRRILAHEITARLVSAFTLSLSWLDHYNALLAELQFAHYFALEIRSFKLNLFDSKFEICYSKLYFSNLKLKLLISNSRFATENSILQKKPSYHARKLELRIQRGVSHTSAELHVLASAICDVCEPCVAYLLMKLQLVWSQHSSCHCHDLTTTTLSWLNSILHIVCWWNNGSYRYQDRSWFQMCDWVDAY